jgi:hypothetical protein
MAEARELLHKVLDVAVTLENAVECLLRESGSKAEILSQFLQRSRRGLVRARG